MRIGDVVECNGTEWSVVRIDERGNPAALRTIGMQTDIRLGSVIKKLNAVVKSKMFIQDDGVTHIELFPPVKPQIK